ncbi:sensor histidine kinase [Cognatishimia sp. MH4019]|uniref:sensor histidine kinase n=1 Tax=Cognatishimia sp. MH4019 TaxID=2854030 RepID=UPI001CD2E1FB|nr:sensor histidine kinase [Cognatishimia sp. MH4019]
MTERVAAHQRLTTRVLFFLTLALVPLGVIGVVQNQRLGMEAELRSDLSLRALTETAASGERQLIQRAFGATQALANSIESVLDDPEVCQNFLKRFLRSDEKFAFVGFIEPDGSSVCSTADMALDYSEEESFQKLLAEPKPTVDVLLDDPTTEMSVLTLTQPVFNGTGLKGFMLGALPLRDVVESEDFLGEANPVTLVTFNHEGTLLSSESGRLQAERKLPSSFALSELAHGESRTFTDTHMDGDELAYAVIPIVPDVVYALSSWNTDETYNDPDAAAWLNIALPFVMWLSSLLVAWFVIDRFVIARVTRLNKAMRRFSQERTVPEFGQNRGAPAELLMIEDGFRSLAEDLIQDEAEQEHRLREKSILLKEVHHRVKNNLQIISSIMNMQIRKARSPETKYALGQVQDRIMGLSGVHRTLYQAETLTQISAAKLIEQIVEQSQAIGTRDDRKVTLNLDLEPVIVFPDQAVPLAMLVSEALTNATKYLGAAEGETAHLSVHLSLSEEETARLFIENTRNPNTVAAEAPDDLSTGLGQQLIRAFATQLNGEIEVHETPTSYAIETRFRVEDFRDEVVDY